MTEIPNKFMQEIQIKVLFTKLKMKRYILIILYFLIFISNSFSQKCDSLSKKAYKYYKNKEYQSAYRVYNELLAMDSLSDKDNYFLGLVCYKKGNLRKAISIFNRLSQKYKNDLKSRFWLANSIFRTDSSLTNAVAQKCFADFVNKAEKDSLKYSKMLFYGYHYLSSYYCFSKNPNYDSAIYFSKKMLTITPSIKKNMIKGFLSLEVIYSRMKNDCLTKFYAKKALELDPENPTPNIIINSGKNKSPINTYKSFEKTDFFNSDNRLNDDTIK